MIPLLLFAGAAVDYERAYTTKVSLQSATDAALLAVMPQVRNGATMATIKTTMQKFIYAATHDSTATIPNAPTQSANGTTVCANSYAVGPTTLMQIARITQVGVSAASCSTFNTDSYEIALVIDNSGSMADSAGNGQTKMQGRADGSRVPDQYRGAGGFVAGSPAGVFRRPIHQHGQCRL